MQYTKMLMAGVVAFALTGCSLHSLNMDPQPYRPAGPAFSMSPEQDEALIGAWYETFGDDKLNHIMRNALHNNLSITQALARLDQADALARQSNALRLPSVDVEGNAVKQWVDGDAQEGYSEIGGAMAWEVDIFNRLGSAAKADRLERDARVEDVEAVRLALTAEVAENYYNAVAQQLQLRLLRQQAGVDKELLDLVDLRLKEGVGTRVDVLQQQGQLADTQSLIPPSEAALRTAENRLDVLVGLAPDGVDRSTADDKFAKIGKLPPIGVPSDLLLNRPDLRALKNSLIAADAEIAAAIADRLPRITLNGSYLYADGPGAANPVGAILGGLVAPLLDWGRRKAEVERNEALYIERLAGFTQAYLEAVEDVENALYQENRQREFIRRLEQRRNVLNETLSAAQEIFKQGLSDYLPVLDAVKDLRTIERSLVVERRNLVLYRIQLFRALGAPVTPSVVKSTEAAHVTTPAPAPVPAAQPQKSVPKGT